MGKKVQFTSQIKTTYRYAQKVTSNDAFLIPQISFLVKTLVGKKLYFIAHEKFKFLR